MILQVFATTAMVFFFWGVFCWKAVSSRASAQSSWFGFPDAVKPGNTWKNVNVFTMLLKNDVAVPSTTFVRTLELF